MTASSAGRSAIEEADLVVPFAGGRTIQLVRTYNSFFDPRGPWGRGWAMDLPHLREIRIPVSREGGKATYTTGYELLTPLNSLYARFKEVRAVKELGGSRLLAPDGEGPFHGLARAQPDFLKNVETHVLFLKDGQQWHFTPHGDLIAIKEGPQLTIYERRADGQVSRIIAHLDGSVAARIDLNYDNQGILTNAAGRSFETAPPAIKEVSYAQGCQKSSNSEY